MTDGQSPCFQAFQFSGVSQLMKLDSSARKARTSPGLYLKRSF